MPGHEDRTKTCADLTEALMSALQPRVMHDIMLEREAHSDLRESLYVYEKLKRLVQDGVCLHVCVVVQLCGATFSCPHR
jgi:hypothetical protein